MKNEYNVKGDVTEIVINSSKYGRLITEISTKDLDRAKEIKGAWYVKWSKSAQSFYVAGWRKSPNRHGEVKLHRWVLGVNDPKIVVDHVDKNTLNNTRKNINKVSIAENGQNRKIQSNNCSGETGVGWKKSSNKWQARIKVNGELKHLGYFSDFSDAVKAREDAERIYFKYKAKVLQNKGG